jgi:hypothetical protein
MNGAIPTLCHMLSWRRQEQLNFNFCFLRISAALFRFASVSLYFGTLLLHIQFYSFYEHSSISPPFTFALFTAVNCTSPYHASYISLSTSPCLPFLVHLNCFFRRSNPLFAWSWQQFLPKRWYPCTRVHAVTFESTTVFTVTKLRASNVSYQLSIERTVSVKQT